MLYITKPKSTLLSKTGDLKYRITAGSISLLGLFLLVTACLVSPNPAGYGTHEQLNLPACGFLERTGYPCPTCGMTTAFSLMVRARPIQAFKIQPAGALAALFCILLVPMAGYAAITGKRFEHWHIRPNGYTMLLIAFAIVLLSWLGRCAIVWFETH